MTNHQPILPPLHAKETTSDAYWWRKNRETAICKTTHPKPGNVCTACAGGVLAYDNLFLLTCNQCGQVAEGGAIT